MSALLAIDRLRKDYGTRVLFDVRDFALDAGRAYVLTGVNGAGKSTLLRMLAGLDAPSAPATVSFGSAVHTLHPYPHGLRRHIVYVHQDPIMFSTSVAHNVGYGLLARGIRGAALRDAVEEAMLWAGVLHLRESDPARLSGGEKQRVALARAKVLEPRLLLLDEPTANLDGPAREQVIALIPTLVSEGRTVVIACHDRDLIGLPGIHRLKLRDGMLEQRS